MAHQSSQKDTDDESLNLSDYDEDRDTLKKRTHALSLTRNYVPDWEPKHAFREFYQNWKDAIMDSFGFGPDLFHLHTNKSANEFLVTAHCAQPQPQSQENAKKERPERVLGFIRYSAAEGSLELTNFMAQLHPAALDLGTTTKKGNNDMAGGHGEGFKCAALVMARTGYSVRFEASRYYWNFKFGGKYRRYLTCSINPMARKKLQKEMHEERDRIGKGFPKRLKGNIWEDVSVHVGNVRHLGGAKINMADFEQWLKLSLDLQTPTMIIKTHHGDLIRDPSFRGYIYLKGLLLEGNSSTKEFKFGYNLKAGSVNRDRQSLTSAGRQAESLAKIWEAAIANNEEDVLAEYVRMLRDDTKWADVDQAEKKITERTARSIWQHLLSMNPDGKYFYHDHKNGDQEVELIRESLKKEPVQLPSSIWIPLTNSQLVRTAQEQRYHLLHNAPVALVEDTPYSAGLRRALSASLTLDSQTRDLNLVFKMAEDAGLDLLLDNTTLMIHEKWLNFSSSHESASCYLSRVAPAGPANITKFSCNHVVTYLYDLIIDELQRRPTGSRGDISERASSLRQRVKECLHQMPLLIDIAPGNNAAEIDVSWIDAEIVLSRLHGLNLEFRVTLHRESTCSERKFDLLAQEGHPQNDVSTEGLIPTTYDQSFANCGCPEQIVSHKDLKATFRGLEIDEDYFPMVCRTESEGLYGLPPKAVRPKVRDEMSFARVDCVEDGIDTRIFDNEDVYGVSDSENDAIRTRTPFIERSLPNNPVRQTAMRNKSATPRADPNPSTPKSTGSSKLGSIEPNEMQELVRLRAENAHLCQKLETVNERLHLQSQQLDVAQKALENQVIQEVDLEASNVALNQLLDDPLENTNKEAYLQTFQAEKTNLQERPDDLMAMHSEQEIIEAAPETIALQELRLENEQLREANEILTAEVERLNGDLAIVTGTLQVVLNSRSSNPAAVSSQRVVPAGIFRGSSASPGPRLKQSMEDQLGGLSSGRAAKRPRLGERID